MPITTVTAKPLIARQEALPFLEASAYSHRCRNRTTAYATTNRVESAPNACGSASPARKMNTVASSMFKRSARELVGCALAAQTNADHAHQMSASASIDSPNLVQLGRLASSVVTCVIANANTRSHSISIGVVRRSSPTSTASAANSVIAPS
jgi:hypothetical protein